MWECAWTSAGDIRVGDRTEVDGAFLGVLGKQLECDRFSCDSVLCDYRSYEIRQHRQFFLLLCFFLLTLFSSPSIAILPVDLCFTDVTFFFKCRPSLSTTGGRITTRIVALTPSLKKYYGYKFCGLWSSNPWDPVAHLHGWWIHVGKNTRCAGL